jgi:hypothetical protein
MMKKDLQRFIQKEPSFGGRIRPFLIKLLPELMRLERADVREIIRVRNALGQLAADYSRNGHHKAHGLITATIRLIKEIRADLFTGEIGDCPTDNHAVTDHAFCAAIRRLGYDIAKYKDHAMEEAIECGLLPVMRENVIVTFLPQIIQPNSGP